MSSSLSSGGGMSPSPVRRRVSPSLVRRRVSPSPTRRRVSTSPVQRRSQRSPSSPPHRNESPVQRRSPIGDRRSTPSRSRSASSYARSSSSPTRHGSPSPIRRKSPKHQASSVQSPSRERIRTREKLSPIARRSSIEEGRNEGDQKPIALDNRLKSSSTNSRLKDSPAKVHYGEDYSPERLAGRRAMENRIHQDDMEVRIKDQNIAREKRGISDRQKSPTVYRDSLPDERQQASYPGEDRKFDEKNHSRSKNSRQHKLESVDTLVEKVDHKNRNGTSGSEESGKHKPGDRGKRKHKRSERQEPASDDDYSYDSEIDERKEAKRRRKEQKKLRKEEKRRRREERRQRRDERRAEKRKGKSQSDFSASDGDNETRKESHQNENEETESEQKKLEIELRNKALESLKAKKGFSH
ncbi:hypothetical protein FNV43_RR13154 [Rhamnella rubrinervis]|uniref:Uncharacterized protein n=1 Tax=Rhamnella rubrinervis TaxID=2594499 RepID=A0A8K0H0K3_9ROSA|nr:hypothetical protein FNV43_RR13154 [Rhamnella rubrinervis]